MKPLDDVLILDLSRVLAGPYCTMRLAELGARVIKVESLQGDATRGFGPPFQDGESLYYMSYNRGKESLSLDLKNPAGREFVLAMVEQADVLVDNFRPGGMTKLGLSDAVLAQHNSQLIHMSIRGYDSQSPRADDAAFDLAIQAESGLMAMTGTKTSGPCRVPISLADLAAGAAAIEGILAGLIQRANSHNGQRLEIALLDALVAMFGYQAQGYLTQGIEPLPLGHQHPNLVPYQAFACRDGDLVLAIANDEQWGKFLSLSAVDKNLTRTEWAHNAGRVEGREGLCASVASFMKNKSRGEWLEIFSSVGVPCASVQTLGECLEQMKAAATGLVIGLKHESLGTQPGFASALRMNGQRLAATSAAPLLGQDNAAILAEFARSDDERKRWQKATGATS